MHWICLAKNSCNRTDDFSRKALEIGEFFEEQVTEAKVVILICNNWVHVLIPIGCMLGSFGQNGVEWEGNRPEFRNLDQQLRRI